MMRNKLFNGVYRADFQIKRRGLLAGMLVFILAGCEWTNDNGETMQSAIPLTLNTWADGKLVADGERWYQFTATAAVQYIHIVRGTVNRLYVQLHDSAGNEIGIPYTHAPFSDTYNSLSLTTGKKYYLKVWPESSGSGAFKIAFTESAEVTPDVAAAMASAVTLTADTWAISELTKGGEDWYKFTATAETQYIHIVCGTVSSLYVQLRNNAGAPLGNTYTYSKYYAYNNLLVASGSVYYLKVWPYGSDSGSYKIAFNTLTNPPSD